MGTHDSNVNPDKLSNILHFDVFTVDVKFVGLRSTKICTFTILPGILQLLHLELSHLVDFFWEVFIHLVSCVLEFPSALEHPFSV